MKAVRFAEGVRPLLIPIDRVKQHPDNPNNGDIEALIESIQQSGFVTAITADVKTGFIIAGNHRYQALHALNAKEIPVIWVDHWEGDDSVRYLIGDNVLGKLAVMDTAMTVRLLGQLNASTRGLAGTGVTENAYIDLLNKMTAPIPTAGGFGHGVAPSGIFQVVVDFRDEDERDNLAAELMERYEGKARTVNL